MSSEMDGPHGHPYPGAPRERERESSDTGIDSEELSPSLQFRHGVCAVAG